MQILYVSFETCIEFGFHRSHLFRITVFPMALQPGFLESTLSVLVDAWNMLHGSAKADWGTEADIDQLHNSATIAKRNIDNISKVMTL